MSTTIDLPCYGIIVILNAPNVEGGYDAGAITAPGLDETVGVLTVKEVADWELGIEGVIQMILGHAMAGLDITLPAYIAGIESVVDYLAEQ